MYMSITQLPPFLHLYTAFLVMLLLKKPVGKTGERVRTPCTSFREIRLDLDTPGYFLGMTQMSLEQRMRLCLVLLLKENYFKCISLNNDKWELGPLLGVKNQFFLKIYCFHLSLLGDNYIPVSMRCWHSTGKQSIPALPEFKGRPKANARKSWNKPRLRVVWLLTGCHARENKSQKWLKYKWQARDLALWSRAWCSCRGPGSGSPNPHGSLQPTISPVPGFWLLLLTSVNTRRSGGYTWPRADKTLFSYIK